MTRRDFITLLGGAAAWPLAARAQQAAVPVIGLVNAGSREASASRVAAFRKGLSETGYVEGQNVAVEYHWLGGEYDRLPTLMADLVGRHVAVIATPGSTVAASAAKTATTTIPIVFGVGEDPVTLGLVSSLARPGGNATGINIFIWEVSAKRLALLHELAPRAVRVAVVINPGNVPSAEATLRELPEAARAIGLQIQILNASMENGVSGFMNTAKIRMPGMSSSSSCSRLPPISVPWGVMPVTFAPGRFRLLTMPAPIGSPTLTKTIGVVAVAACAAWAANVPKPATITSGLVRTSSAASCGRRSERPSAERKSKIKFLPSV